MTIRPPGRVTRTISLPTSNGPGGEHGAKDADHEVERLVGQSGQISRVAYLEVEVREALLLCTPVPGLDKVAGNIHAENVRAKLRRWQGRRAVLNFPVAVVRLAC